MTVAPSPTTTAEVVLIEPDHRGAGIAVALGARRVKRGGVRYFLPPYKGEQWKLLYEAGYHAVRRNGGYRFTRTRTPMPLDVALAECREEAVCSR